MDWPKKITQNWKLKKYFRTLENFLFPRVFLENTYFLRYGWLKFSEKAAISRQIIGLLEKIETRIVYKASPSNLFFGSLDDCKSNLAGIPPTLENFNRLYRVGRALDVFQIVVWKVFIINHVHYFSPPAIQGVPNISYFKCKHTFFSHGSIALQILSSQIMLTYLSIKIFETFRFFLKKLSP